VAIVVLAQFAQHSRFKKKKKKSTEIRNIRLAISTIVQRTISRSLLQSRLTKKKKEEEEEEK
jgi:hypothetical protein